MKKNVINMFTRKQQSNKAVIGKTNNSKKEKKSDIKFKLSLPPIEETTASSVQKEYLQEEIDSLPPVKMGHVNIHGIYAYDQGDKIEVNAYIRNAVDKAVNVDEVNLKIINSKNEILASQMFNMRDMGSVAPYCARPWKIYFDKENVFVSEISLDDWQVVFGTDMEIEKTAKIELENFADNGFKKDYEEFLDKLPPIKVGAVSIVLYEMKKRENGDLSVTVVIRNATDKKITMKRLPVTVGDKEIKLVVATGAFNIEKGQINPSKAQVHNLVFKKEEILLNEDEYNLDNCKVIFKEIKK
jgi:SLAP domain-containing protein